MAVTYAGAIHGGVDSPGTSRYYSMAVPGTGSGDFALFAIVRLPQVWLGDPLITTSNPIYILNNGTAVGTGGNDCWFRMTPSNAGGTKLALDGRLARGGTNVLSSGTVLFGSANGIERGKTYVLVLQSLSGTVSLKSCEAGGSVVTHASVARNGSFNPANLGTWLTGAHSSGPASNVVYQAFGLAAGEAFSDAEIEALATGTDPETYITSGARTALWLFDSVGATISPTWGTPGDATRNGTWTNGAVTAPVVPNATDRIEVSNHPDLYGFITPGQDATADASYTWTGTYAGITPATFQYRVEGLDGTQVVDWTNLSSFSAAAGSWSGIAALPPGGLYRIKFRDSVETTVTWTSQVPFNVGPCIADMGQSPFVFFETDYKSGETVADELYVICPRTLSDVFVYKPATGEIGAGYAAMSQRWATVAPGVPLLAIASAATGTSIANWASEAGGWPGFLSALTDANVSDVLLSWQNGASDLGTDASVIKSGLDTLYALIETEVETGLGMTFRFRMLPMNRYPGSSTDANKVRVAQREWAEDHADFGTKVLLGPWWGDMQGDIENTGTAQAGTNNTITLATTMEAVNSAPVGGSVIILSGTGAGQTRTVSSFNSSTKVLTVSSNWTTNPNNTSVYAVYGTTPHPDRTGTRRFGPPLAQDTAYHFNLAAEHGVGPTVATATYPEGGDGSIIDVTFAMQGSAALTNHDAVTVDVAGFSVSDDSFSTTETITDAEITAANKVRLTLSGAPGNLAGLQVRYGHGEVVGAADWYKAAFGLGTLLIDDSDAARVAMFTDAPVGVTEAATPSSGQSSMNRGGALRDDLATILY